MNKPANLFCIALLFLCSSLSFAEPEYVTIELEIDINKSAEEVWEKVGGFCDIGVWLNVECEITSGEGGVGTVRSLVGGRVAEVLIAQSEFGYGYTIPPTGGAFYNLYHGFMEARPMTGSTSKMLYTLVYDVSDKASQEEKDQDVSQRRTIFETALDNMKKIAEAN